MEELYTKLKNIIEGTNESFAYKGLVVYFLSDEEEPYKLYKIGLESNDTFKETIKNNINSTGDSINFFYYPECTSPDGNDNISYLSVNEIPKYNIIREYIKNDKSTYITRRQLLNIINNIKGYAIKILYTENTTGNVETIEDKEIICFSKLTKGNFFKPEHPLFSFGNGNEDLLKQQKEIFLTFNEKIAAINIENTVFILHGYYFEQLLKYDEYINVSANMIKESIKNQHLISNMDLFDAYYESNKHIRKILYKIEKRGTFNNIKIDNFKDLKNRFHDALLFRINDNNTISIEEDSPTKSIMHILRIYDDETAETIISRTGIFANQKIDIK